MSSRESALTWFVRELKRRGVVRVGLAYLATGWFLTEPASTVIEAFNLPQWLLTLAVIALFAGFPLAMVLAWLFEIKDGVIYRTETFDALPAGEGGVSLGHDRRLTIYTAVMVILAAGLFFSGFVFRGFSDSDNLFGGGKKIAIAVLPFADMSPDRNQGYFAEGVAEEILNLLSRDSNIPVVGRTSAWVFKDRTGDIAAIRDGLKVSHILEGGVRTAGDVVRITVRLIETTDGHNVWSEDFTRPMTDIFAVQDEIGGVVVKRLKGSFAPAQAATVVSADEARAYDMMLAARQKLRTRDVPAMEEARTMLLQASELAPKNAQILTLLAEAYLALSDGGYFYGSEPLAEAKIEAARLIKKAQALDPHDVGAYHLLAMTEPTSAAAIKLAEQAIAIDPKALGALNVLGTTYMAQGELVKALEVFRRAIAIDPLFIPGNVNMAIVYSALGRFEDAYAVLEPLNKSYGNSPVVRALTNMLTISRGDVAGGLRDAQKTAAEIGQNFRNDAAIGMAYLLLGEREKARGLGGSSSIELAIEAGDIDEAVALARPSFVSHDRLQRNDTILVGEALVRAGRDKEYLDLLGPIDAEEFADFMAGDIATAIPTLAVALRRTGREGEIGALLRILRGRLTALDAAGRPDAYRGFVWSRLLMLEGNRKEALTRLEWAIDHGWKGQANWPDSSYQLASAISTDPADFPEFAALRTDTEFLRIRGKFWSSINAERAKVDLGPLPPPVLK